MPMAEMERILAALEEGTITSAEALSEEFARLKLHYQAYAYDWALGMVADVVGHEPTQEDLARAIALGESGAARLKGITDADRLRDFDEVSQVGYGVDSLEEADRLADFNAVRGVE